MYRFLVFCIILSSVPYSHSLANTGEKLTAVWNTFWSTSCPLSTIVSRTRRSIELPDIENPTEIFNYLFPLANVSPEAAGGSRSSSSSSSSIPTISTWMDDVVDLWQHECQRRHKNTSQKKKQRLQKRSSVRNQGMAVTPTPGQTETDTGVEDAVITWAGYLGNLSSSFYSSYHQEPEEEDELSFSPPAPAAPGFSPLSFLNTDFFTTTITYPDDYEESQSQDNLRKKYEDDVVKDREGDHSDDADSGGDVDADPMEQAESQSKGSFEKSNYRKAEDKYKENGNAETESDSDNSEEAEEEEEEDDQNDDDDDEETTTKNDEDEATTKSSKSGDTTTAATTTTTTAAPEDPYFSSYGGDIEYFFPILSFTIPFDGEITLLGFHGFKGMLPY